MKPKFCPKCKEELKPIYKDVFKTKDKDEYRTIDGAIARPSEWFCENCKEIFRIEVVGIVC